MENMKKHMLDFLDYCRAGKNLSEKTLKAYRIDLKQYFDFAGGGLDKNEIYRYIDFLNSLYQPRTVKRKIAVLKAYIHFLLLEDHIAQDPFHKISISFREPKTLPRIVPLSIIRDALKAAYTDLNQAQTTYRKDTALRDVLILELLFATGARVSEICSLTLHSVDMQTHTIMIFGKGSKERRVQIENDDVIRALDAYYQRFEQEIRQSGCFFVNKLHHRITDQSIRLIVRKYVQAAGYTEHVTPHMYRHSFATFLLEEDVDIRYIQRLLGHSSIATTQIYTYVAMAKQKAILATKHPRNKFAIEK